jgi:RNA polymerase primary sigma factor
VARSAATAVLERSLVEAARRGDRRAQERIVRDHLGAVRAIARAFRGLGLPLDDLVQEGSIGLLEAIDDYDPARGSFDSYARLRIRRAVRNALTDQARLIRLPKHVVERRRAIDRAEARLSATGTPSLSDLASASGLTVADVVEARRFTAPPVSLDAPVLPDGSPLEALVADPNAEDPVAETVLHEDGRLLARALAQLSYRQRRVVCAQLGLDGRARVGGVAVAEELGLSPRRAQTIGREALYRLREDLQLAGFAA